MTLAHKLAEEFIEVARMNFERDGTVDPLLFVFINETDGLGLTPAKDGHPVDLLPELAHAAGCVLDVKWIVVITESWMKAVKPGEINKTVRRGDLAKEEAAGSPDVVTAVVVTVIEVKDGDPEGSMAMAVPTRADDGGYAWKNSFMDGELHGGLPEKLLSACRWGSGMTPPQHLEWVTERRNDVEFWAETFVQTSMALTALAFHREG